MINKTVLRILGEELSKTSSSATPLMTPTDKAVTSPDDVLAAPTSPISGVATTPSTVSSAPIAGPSATVTQ